jgi:broad specificity phosphatase PhoE
MKKTILILILTIISYACSNALPSTTTIYIVRHAEKDISDPKNQDPELNDSGRNRAKDLNKKLKNQQIDAVFSSKFKRTKQTGAAVAERNGVSIIEYDAHNYKAISELVKTKYKNKRVLIIGHSNTVLELIESFGAARPLAALSDDDYDFFFEVKIDHMSKVALSTKQYGASHRSSHIK